ncbi:MAG TPA: type VI secretion system contractile sheath large subunit [Polyangiaceae bacterium]
MPTRRDLTFTLSTGNNEQPGDEGAATGGHGPGLRFLVLGDFSRNQRRPAVFKSRRVTFDNFDEVLSVLTRSFGALDQFHPDFLADTDAELQQLLQLRRHLKEPTKRQAALEELVRLQQRLGALKVEPESPASASAQPSEAEPELLARLLGGRATAVTPEAPAAHAPPPATGTKAAVDRFVQHVLKASPAASPVSTDRGADDLVIELLNARCRTALLEPDFRALERAWRSLHWLVSRLESEQGEVHVLDISKTELTEHLAAHARNLDASPLVQLLCDDADGWDFLIGDYSFGFEIQDLVLLGNLGAIAARAGAPFLAHGDLSLAGCPSPDLLETPGSWSFGDPELAALAEQVRKHPAAQWIGLAAPRFLLRHPYGKRSDPIESFPFEELPADPEVERFLWGNPAFACAWILGQAHGRGGARWPLRQMSHVPDLPMPCFTAHGGDDIQLPLELSLTEAAQATLAQHGLIAFAGSRNSNRISTPSLHALASS